MSKNISDRLNFIEQITWWEGKVNSAPDTMSHNVTATLPFYEVEAPLRHISPHLVRPILRAIREQLAIDIGYISLSRFNDEAVFEGKADKPATLDLAWHTQLDVVIEPDPRLSDAQKRVIARRPKHSKSS